MKNFTIEIKWAFRFILLTLAWSIGEKMLGLYDIYINNYFFLSMIFALPAILFYILALQEKKKYFFNNEMSWTQGFTSGMVLTFIITLLLPLALFVIYSSVAPHFFENLIAYKLKTSKITLEEAQKIVNMKEFIIDGTIGGLSKGIITGAIVSLFIRTKK